MQAQDRRLPQWFERVATGQIALPRFQRMEAWTPPRVAGLLTTVLRGLPSGAALILQVGDTMPFVSRQISGQPASNEATNELLLDGQQRVTALWRALNDDYEDRVYFVSEDGVDEVDGSRQPEAISVKFRNGKYGRLPQWLDSPAECWEKGYIPARLLRPGDLTAEINEWVKSVVGTEDLESYITAHNKILRLREQVTEFNLPYLALPPSTPRHVALDVFIKMNTSAVVLSSYDIIVAQAEAATGKSLHELVDALRAAVPSAGHYRHVPDLVLDTAALMQDRTPNNAGYLALDLRLMVGEWERIEFGVDGMVTFLAEEGIHDKSRLPTVAVLPVMSALSAHMPTAPDQLGEARRLLRKYLWRANFTDRYESAAAGKALADYRALLAVLQGTGLESAVPIFNEENYPLPTIEQLISAKWPKNVGILARGILALSLRAGARDIADGTPASRQHLVQREYHHLFPVSLLAEAGIGDWESYRALNCALITWRTNRTISNKHPVDYLRERADASMLGEVEVASRLRSHLVPYEYMAEQPDCPGVREMYERFLRARAIVVSRALEAIWNGNDLSDLSTMFEHLDDALAALVDSAEDDAA